MNHKTEHLGRVPIVIGVTGHRDIPKRDFAAIKAVCLEFFSALRARYPATEVVVLSALAAGADSICAAAAIESGCTLRAPLPFAAKDYREDFSDEDAAAFDELLAACDLAFAAPFSETPENAPPRSFHYRQAGKYIVEHSHLLLALWDGNENDPATGGTADVVAMARRKQRSERENPLDSDLALPVLHLPVSRGEKGETFSRISPEAINDAAGLPLFAQIEAFNTDVLRFAGFREEGGAQDDLFAVFQTADTLALRNQTKRGAGIRAISLLGLGLVLAFLLYDETVSFVMLVLYGALLALMYVIYRRQKKGLWHERYLLCRVLAETARVQLHMNAAGVAYCPSIPLWRREPPLVFVQNAVRIFGAPAQNGDAKAVEKEWIDGQLAYHENSEKRKGKRHKTDESWTRALLLIAILFYLCVLLVETIAPGYVETPLIDLAPLPLPMNAILTPGALFKIGLGSLFAGIAFLSSYYGKHALPEQIENDKKMYTLFELAKQRLAETPDDALYTRSVFTALADAHIEEITNWFLSQSGRGPEMSL